MARENHRYLAEREPNRLNQVCTAVAIGASGTGTGSYIARTAMALDARLWLTDRRKRSFVEQETACKSHLT
jgi:hypothetical protein